MVFSSITFLFYFLPIVLIVYYIMPSKFRNTVILISSFAFYFFGEPKYTLLMIFSIISTYIFGILIDKNKKNENAKIFLILSITISVLLLVYFKYIDFIIENINLFFAQKISLIRVVLPIGISFYTFQMISYTIDVYKGEANVQKNILKLATYVSLFPQLIAGPIVRYTTVEKELEKREYKFSKFAYGVRRFIIGLGKKVIIANSFGELQNIFVTSGEKSVLFYWIYAVSIMLQIYFDFSGYSDMAIGLGKMLGFDFLENFNYPYVATSITDFWRRWHISLSTWFRDYIYIPLGGNRVTKIKWFRNIFIVWLLTGLWHGASWNFIIWGLFFGVFLIIEKILFNRYLEKLPVFLKRIYTLIVVMISFVIFNGTSLIQIGENLMGLIGIGNIPMTSPESIYYLKSYLILFVVAIIGATPILKNIVTTEKFHKVSERLEPIYLLAILIISTSYIVDGSFNPFLYFRF